MQQQQQQKLQVNTHNEENKQMKLHTIFFLRKKTQNKIEQQN